MDFFTSPFELPFVQRGLFELLLLSIGAGLLGTWIVLRGLAFYSHAVGTAAFPGLVIADGLGFAAPIGALGAALVFAAVLARLAGRRGSGYDSLTALVLTGAIALGVILASDVFHSGSNIESLLFGSVLLIEQRDLLIAGGASALAVITTASFGRAWVAAGFDPSGARALGVRSVAPELLLLVLIAVTVIASVAAVGALLVTAVLVTPAATVRLWSNRLNAWRAGTIVLTAVEGTVGLWISVKANSPPGAVIAVVAAATFALAAIGRVLVARLSLRTLAPAAVAIAGLTLVSCGDGSESKGGKVDAVATTTQIGDWVRQVGGDAVAVHQILNANIDAHEYEPRPSDVEAAAGADVVFVNGDNLDHWAEKLVKEAGGDPEVVDLARAVPNRLQGDPHWWHDPRNAAKAVSLIAETLLRLHRGPEVSLVRRASTYLDRLHFLDEAITDCIERIPASQRKLVTDHEAFGYFAKRYGLKVVGAVIPSQTTEAQPSAGELSELAALIKRERVRAIFPEKSVNPKVARAIAKQTGASLGGSLYSDALGTPGSDGGTYLDTEKANARSIARGLSGGKIDCRS
jgi:ABC-type Zn uptake system ZnuABC Zn-binding protein ZnuA/ABC-type Mn2+/Zn2+ transport system permease subunit